MTCMAHDVEVIIHMLLCNVILNMIGVIVNNTKDEVDHIVAFAFSFSKLEKYI